MAEPMKLERREEKRLRRAAKESERVEKIEEEIDKNLGIYEGIKF